MEKQLTPAEAWTDFINSVLPSLPRPVDREIHRANSHSRANKLGSKRIHRLLDKYSPGRYKWHLVEYIIITPPPDPADETA